MRSSHRFHTWLLVFAFAGWGLAAPAAEWEKYLLDDTNFVLSVNVKQILQSPLFTKHHQKQVEELLKTEGVQAVLKDTGFNPLQDVERLVVVMGKSSFPDDEGKEKEVKELADHLSAGPLILVQGRFDPDKIQARIEQVTKDMPELLKVHGIGKANVAEVTISESTSNFFAVLLDKNTLVLALRRDQIEDVLEKAAGDRKTELKDPALQQLLKAMDLKQAINVAATSDMVVNSRYSPTTQNNKTTFTVKYERLRDFGIETLTGKASVGNDIRGKVMLAAKDAESAEKLSGRLEQGLNWFKIGVEKELAREKDLAPFPEALKRVKITAKDKAVTLEGHAGPDAVRATLATFRLEPPKDK